MSLIRLGASVVPIRSSTSTAREARSRSGDGSPLASAARRLWIRWRNSAEGFPSRPFRRAGAAVSPRARRRELACSRASNSSASRSRTRRAICSAVGASSGRSRSRSSATAWRGAANRSRIARPASRGSRVAKRSHKPSRSRSDRSGSFSGSAGRTAVISQTSAVQSSLPDTSLAPSGEMAREVTGRSWPWNWWISFPMLRS